MCCANYYLERTVVFLCVEHLIHEDAGLLVAVRLELVVQQSFSLSLLLKTMVFVVSKCV
jgi:hypothetical protein